MLIFKVITPMYKVIKETNGSINVYFDTTNLSLIDKAFVEQISKGFDNKCQTCTNDCFKTIIYNLAIGEIQCEDCHIDWVNNITLKEEDIKIMNLNYKHFKEYYDTPFKYMEDSDILDYIESSSSDDFNSSIEAHEL